MVDESGEDEVSNDDGEVEEGNDDEDDDGEPEETEAEEPEPRMIRRPRKENRLVCSLDSALDERNYDPVPVPETVRRTISVSSKGPLIFTVSFP